MSDLYLDSRKTALIAIDLQNAIMGIHTAPYPATEVVQRNRQIADQLRARGGFSGRRSRKELRLRCGPASSRPLTRWAANTARTATSVMS